MEPDSFKLGIQAARAGDYKTAQTYFIQVVKANPNSEKGWLYLGHCLAEPELRKECYQKVLKLNPYNPDAHKALSSLNQPNLSQEINPYAEVRRSAPQPPAAIAEPAPPVSAVKSKKRSRATTLVLSGCGVSLVLCLGLFLVVALLPKNSSSQALSTPTTQSTTPGLDAASLPAPAAPTGTGKVCVGSWNRGVACLDERGWQTYNTENSDLPTTSISTGAICPDGRLAIAHTKGFSLVSVPDQQWEQIVDLDQGYGMARGLACDRDGRLWAAHYKGVSRYVDGAWQTYGIDLLATGKRANDHVSTVVATPDGKIWALTVKSVAMFADDKWTIFQAGQGLSSRPITLTVDAAGRPWVGLGDAMVVYTNGSWQEFEIKPPIGYAATSLDARGWLWLGSFDQGAASFDGKAWSNYNRETDSLSSDRVYALAADSLGRVWAGTTDGLSVFDGSQWQTYRMDNSDLLENKVLFLVVERDGPTLPPPVDKEKGSLTGTLPLRNKRVELCLDYVADDFSGETPCADQLFHMLTQTDQQGVFTFENIPAGYYSVVAETNTGWAKFYEKSGSELVLIQAGEQRDLGELTITQNPK